MILPIVAYGAPILQQKANSITPDYPELSKLIQDMWETLDNADGVGLAAPQINRSIRLFLVDSMKALTRLPKQEQNDHPDYPGIRKVFINAVLLNYGKDQCIDQEGCLSIPGISAKVKRPHQITIQYQDEYFNEYTELFYGETARMIQHEYDHIEGKLYLDYLNPLQKRLLKNKLLQVAKGKVRAKYPMTFS